MPLYHLQNLDIPKAGKKSLIDSFHCVNMRSSAIYIKAISKKQRFNQISKVKMKIDDGI